MITINVSMADFVAVLTAHGEAHTYGKIAPNVDITENPCLGSTVAAGWAQTCMLRADRIVRGSSLGIGL